tara:strand:+ start:69259 stop:69660 length:402 start_codon:yes stop_codon:yes gene_type:complete
MRTPVYKTLLGVYAIIESSCDEKILLKERTSGPYKGLYDFPGGTITEQEILEQALVRVVRTETNQDIDGCKQYKTMSSLYEYQEGSIEHVLRHIGILYHAKIAYQESSKTVWKNKSDILGRDLTPFVSIYLGK